VTTRKKGLLQLDDLNQDKSEFQRSFSSDIRKCQEMQRKLRALELSVQECFPMRFQNKEEPISREELNTVTLEELDKHLSSLEETVQEMNGHWKSLNSHRQQLLEHHYVLVLGSHLFRPG
jgi:V-type H+-transporting ATPase subunit a